MSRVCVHGLGYIGLPTAATFATAGHNVVGVDTNEDVVASLRKGDIHIDEPGLQSCLTEALDAEQLELATEPVPAEYHLICVPTPIDEDEREADLSYVKAAGAALSTVLRPGDTVILESTVPPRTTTDVLGPILETSGLEIGRDVELVYCPETVLPGNVLTELRENDRIVGGAHGDSPKSAVALYDSVVTGEIRTAPNATTAEFVKLIQNTFRDTNIALANEIGKLATDYGIDGRTAIDLANSHPRVGVHEPGPGVGGHCLPIDPWFLGQDSDELDLIETAREINDGMVEYVVALLADQLDETTDVDVAVLGAAYKGNVSDTRQSPGLALAQSLRISADATPGTTVADGGRFPLQDVNVTVHDPHVDDEPTVRNSLEDTLSGADAAIVVTDHDEYENLDPERIDELLDGDVVLDTKGVLEPATWESSNLQFRRF